MKTLSAQESTFQQTAMAAILGAFGRLRHGNSRIELTQYILTHGDDTTSQADVLH